MDHIRPPTLSVASSTTTSPNPSRHNTSAAAMPAIPAPTTMTFGDDGTPFVLPSCCPSGQPFHPAAAVSAAGVPIDGGGDDDEDI